MGGLCGRLGAIFRKQLGRLGRCVNQTFVDVIKQRRLPQEMGRFGSLVALLVDISKLSRGVLATSGADGRFLNGPGDHLRRFGVLSAAGKPSWALLERPKGCLERPGSGSGGPRGGGPRLGARGRDFWAPMSFP
eukprot:9103161-Pyramimonas_sp.AAC.1